MNFTLKKTQVSLNAKTNNSLEKLPKLLPSMPLKAVSFILSVFVMVTAINTVTMKAAHAANNEGWFEIEVILLSQLGDKSHLKEVFNQVSAQRLAEKNQRQKTTNEQRKLKLLNQMTKKKAGTSSAYVHKDGTPTLTLLHDFVSPNIQHLKNTMPVCSTSELPFNDIEAKLTETFNKQLTEQFLLAVKPETIAKETLEAEFNAINKIDMLSNQNTAVQTRFNLNTFTPNTACVWSEPYFDFTQSLATKNKDKYQSSYYKVVIEKMPLVIDAPQQAHIDEPYLLSANDLQLTNIIKELKYSRDFKPLMHFGWRQYTVDKFRATPLKLMAGNNIDSQFANAKRKVDAAQMAYQAALQNYKNHSSALNTDDADIQAMRIKEQEAITQQHIENAKTALIQEHLAEIYNNIKKATPAKETLIAELNSPLIFDEEELTSAIEANDSNNLSVFSENTLHIKPKAPAIKLAEKPEQSWFLEGFLTVHVSHYLHITADFNMMNKVTTENDFILENTPKKQGSIAIGHNASLDKKNELYSIHFEQDRRVYSSDLHYFDHPHMGMLIEIRRFTPPEDDEKLTN